MNAGNPGIIFRIAVTKTFRQESALLWAAAVLGRSKAPYFSANFSCKKCAHVCAVAPVDRGLRPVLTALIFRIIGHYFSGPRLPRSQGAAVGDFRLCSARWQHWARWGATGATWANGARRAVALLGAGGGDFAGRRALAWSATVSPAWAVFSASDRTGADPSRTSQNC
jgi:hypothetical protein